MLPPRRVLQTVTLTIAVPLLVLFVAEAQTRDKGDEKTTKLTFTLHGAHCKDCVDRLRSSLKTLKGVKFKDDDVKPAKEPRRLRPRYFSPLFEVSVDDIQATNVGAFAAAVKKGGTPHEEDVETGVDLVLFPEKMISEELIMDFRSALRDVNGVEVDASGGLGGNFKEEFIWIRLEDAGGAALEDVLRAARSVDSGVRTIRKRDQ